MKQSELHEWLDYDPATGVFTWKKSPAHSVKAGDIAGNPNKTRGGTRMVICIKGRRFYAARGAYIYAYGDIPSGALIDHIDGDMMNNRLVNLRLANTAQNTWNRIQRAGSKYKLGVSKDPRSRFKARIQMPDGRKLNLGTWDTEDEAHAAYMGAAAILHSDFWLGHRDSKA